MAKSETTELRELETVEVSLVDKGANKRVFAIKKSERKNMKVIDAILSTPFEKEDVVLEALKKAELSNQAVEGVKSAIQILSAFQEEVPENLIKDLMRLGGLAKEEEEEEAEPVEETEEEATEKQEEGEGQEEDEDELQKRLSNLPTNVRSMVEQLWKSNRTAITKAEMLEAKIKKAEDEKRLGECVVLAKELSALPVESEQLGAFIKSMDNDENSDFVLSLLKSTNELIAKGGITDEIGKSTSGGELNAIAKAERMADVMVEKDGVTRAKALATVWKSNPNLYAEYQQEKKGS